MKVFGFKSKYLQKRRIRRKWFVLLIVFVSLLQILRYDTVLKDISDWIVENLSSAASGECQFPLPTLSLWSEWKCVQENTYVLSAFLDVKDDIYSILIIGISNKTVENNHLCRVWSADLKLQIVQNATGRVIPDNHLRKYSNWMYECDVSVFNIYDPGFVSIVETECQRPTQVLVLQNARHSSARNHVTVKTAEKDKKVNFTVCLSPLHSSYDSHKQLIEWIEINRMFGVERFIVYKHSCGSNVDRVLRHYNEEGIVETIPWKIPVMVQANSTEAEEIHYFGQTTALNDCLHRLRNYSRFVINVDVDEIVVPRNAYSYIQMLQNTHTAHLPHTPQRNSSLEPNHSSNPNSDELDKFLYLVKNTFFLINESRGFISNNPQHPLIKRLKKDIYQLDIRSLWVIIREPRVYQEGIRSKLIVSTRDPPAIGVHKPYTYSPSLVIPGSEGLLHHYRSTMWKRETESVDFIDTYMHKFEVEIISRLRSAHKQIDLPLA